MVTAMQGLERKMYKLLENTVEKDGIVFTNGRGCAISENLIIKIQDSKKGT